MKKSKKLLMTLSLFSLVSTLSGCSKNSNPSTTSSITNSTTSSTSSVEPEVTPTFKYTVNDSNEITITSINDDTVTDLVIPDEIDGKKVVSISLTEDSYGRNVKSIKFGKNVSNIKLYNVYFQNLEKIEVDENNGTYIAKENCIYSKKLWRRSDGSTYRSLYYGCKGAKIQEADVEGYHDVYISTFAFQNSNIESIHIPANVSDIWASDYRNPFSTTRNLKTITVDKNNTTYNDGNGSNVIIYHDSEYNYNGLIATCDSYIPNDASICTRIECGAIYYTDKERITIPNNITYIADQNFQDCPNLTTFEIPENLTNIATTFKNCPKLKNFIINENNQKYKFENDMLISIYKSKYYLVRYFGSSDSLTLDSNFVQIQSFAFYNNKTVKNIILPTTVNAIGSNVFENSALEEINLENVTTMTSKAFGNCKNLKTINLRSISSFGTVTAFEGAIIETLILPQSADLQSVGIIDESYVKSLEFEGSATNYKKIGNQVLSNDGTILYFIFGDEKNIVVEDSVTEIKRLKIYNKNYESVKFPSGLKIIKNIQNSTGLKTIDIPSLVEIGAAFVNTDLEEIKLYDNLTSIGKSAFQGTKKLKELIIPSSVTTLGTSILTNSACINLELKNKSLVFKTDTLGSSNVVKTFKYHGTMIDFKKSFTTKEIFDKNFPKLEKLQLLDTDGTTFIDVLPSDLTYDK